MKQFVQRAGGRIGLWGGLLAAALAAFAAGWLVPARAPVGCNLNELTTAPDFSPFSPAAPAVAASDAGTPAAPSLPEKWVCLTFDDGPSKNTRPILEILDKEQVPATFFVCAQDANEKYLPLVADIAAAGHQIALHSATHQYSKIYASTDAFWQDIRTLRQALEPYVDVAAIDWLRFPGGSTNTVSHRYGGNGIMKALKAQAEDKGYHWIDWNVCAEDATASHPDAAQILRNIRRDADGQDTCVVLLHDTKATGQTVKALPDMIAYFREQGYTFCTVAQMDALQCETK